MGVCKHGLEEETCYYCSGEWEKESSARERYKGFKVARAKFNAKRKKLQEESKIYAVNHNKKFTEDDLRKIVVNTLDIEKDDLGAIYGLAKDMGRTMASIDWMIFSLYDSKFAEMCERRRVSDITRLERLMEIKEEVETVK